MQKNKIGGTNGRELNRIVIAGNAADDTKHDVRADGAIVFDLGDLKRIQPGLLTRTLLWLVPRWGVTRLARELGYPLSGVAQRAHDVFADVRRVDVLPAGDLDLGQGGGRGFQLVLDGNLALYFFQDGNHFVYDGYEMGEYEQGDVRVFDEGISRRGWEVEDWDG